MKRALVTAAATAALVALYACADADSFIAIGGGESEIGGFVGGPDASEASTPPPPVAMCASAVCPAPYATCADAYSGIGPAFPCMTDTSTDRLHCGGCGIECPSGIDALGVLIDCIEGTCKARCDHGRLDCNGTVDDGCEVSTQSDAKNCGTCGNVCPDGKACIEGQCGCPPGTTLCGGQCVDLASDDGNCGSCGFSCVDNGPDAGALPPHMVYGCHNGACTAPKCERRSGFWENCNGVPSDGCEQNLTQTDADGRGDPNNCGKCGKTCPAGKVCLDLGGNGFDCQCSGTKTLCGMTCADLDNDPMNCGSCSFACPIPTVALDNGGKATCEQGRCGFECSPGRANCNGTLDDGCEADLGHDPLNCGGCGITCDRAAGQPCVDGKCVVTPCDGGTVTK